MMTQKKSRHRRTTEHEPNRVANSSSSRLLLHLSEPITAASARLWMPDSVLHTLPRTGEGRFSLVIGFRLRLRRHAKGTCDFLFRTFTNGALPDVTPCHFSKKRGLRTIHPTCMQLALPSRWKPKIDGSPIPPRRTWRFQKCCTPVWLVFSNTTRMRCWVLPGSVQPSGNMTPSLRGKKQSPMSDYGHSDGRYAPIGNTSSVIDGEPSHALRALLLRIWRAVLLLLSAVASSCPDVLMYPDPAQLSSSKEMPSTHSFRDAQPYFRTRHSYIRALQ